MYNHNISIHLMLRFIAWRFSLSIFHVLFQYISCYGLSEVILVAQFDRMLFQYISCYGLSKFDAIGQEWEKHFNTSHVTVYHNYESAPHIHRLHFNTSHVTVYLYKLTIMLIWIRKFQYISGMRTKSWTV